MEIGSIAGMLSHTKCCQSRYDRDTLKELSNEVHRVPSHCCRCPGVEIPNTAASTEESSIVRRTEASSATGGPQADMVEDNASEKEGTRPTPQTQP